MGVNITNLADGDIAYRASNTAATTGGVAGANKLWLPLWSGEVIHAYDQYNVFENLITTKSLTGGFSYEFPVTGTVALNAAWDAGEELGGSGGSSTTFKVNLDSRPMAAHFETDNVDALITQWDYRSELARQSGQQLANTRDRQLGATLLAASLLAPLGFSTTADTGEVKDPRGYARTDFPQPNVVGQVNTDGVGVAVTNCTETTAVRILKAIEDYFVFMQEHDYPTNNVYCVVTPKVFQTIRGLGITRAGDVPATTSSGTNFTKYPMFAGSSEMGMLGAPLGMGMNALSDSLEYMGCKIIKSNHLPNNKDYATNVIGSRKYNLNSTYFDVFGFIFQPEAIAGLSLMGMKVDTVQDVRRNTQFTVASMMKGTGVIRPELVQALVGINSATAYNETTEIDSRRLCAALINTTNANLANGFAAEYAVTSA
jgi:hypothetical protein